MITLNGQRQSYSFNENEPLQQSKFAKVFKGNDANRAPVLVKQLLTSTPTATEIRRFKNEYAFRVNHPNLLVATEYVVTQNQHYIVRPWVDGTDLSKKLKRYKIADVLQLIIPVLDALEALHQNKVLHLDIQPKNIIVGTDKTVWLTDLGLALKQGETPSTRQPFSIYYAAPEQVLNFPELYTPATDLYAVGMLLVELLMGAKPFEHQNPEVLMNLLLASPLPEVNLSKPWVDFLLKATHKPRFLLPPTHYEPDELLEQLKEAQLQRFASVAAFKEALLSLPTNEKKWWFW